MANIFDLNLEQYLISGVLTHPEVFPDVDGYIVSSDFKNKLHQTIWNVIKSSLHSGESIDKIRIAQKIDKLSLSFEDKINSVADYLDQLELIQIKKESVRLTAQELKTVSLRRNIAKTGEEIVKAMQNHPELNAEQIVALSDKIYTKIVNGFKGQNEPVDLFKGAADYIAALSNNKPSEEILCPYKGYQQFFGGFFPGDLVLFASAPKSGKSSLLSDMLRKICESKEENVKALIIDTELETYRVQRRMISAISGVNEYIIKSKKWLKYPEFVKKINEALKLMQNYFNKIDHIYVGNVSTDEMASVVRRWHWKNVKKGDKAIVAIDYFKLTGADNVLDAFAASMSLGYRVDTFKKLASELQIPVIGACQTNKQNQVGLSHEVNKFVSSLFLFEKKTSEEVQRDEFDYNNFKRATHKLVPLYTRDLGEHCQGINDLVQVPSSIGKKIWVPNYLNFRLDNFNVIEMGDLRTQISKQTLPDKFKITTETMSLDDCF